MLQRAALNAGEDRRVDLLLDLGVGLAEDDAAARAAQGLVGGGGDHVGERHRVRVDAGGDKAGDVRHVDQQEGADFIGNGAKARPVDHAGVGGEAGDDQLGLVFAGQALDLGVVDLAGRRVEAVLHGVVALAGEVDLGAVGQVTAVGQGHAEHGVARLDQGEEDRAVGLRAGMRLHVGPVGAEQCLDAIDGELLDHVDILAAAVVTLARIALGVLVGQHGALGLHDARAGVVFRGNQLDVLFLAQDFFLHRVPELIVVACNRHVTGKHSAHLNSLKTNTRHGPGQKLVARSLPQRFAPGMAGCAWCHERDA